MFEFWFRIISAVVATMLLASIIWLSAKIKNWVISKNQTVRILVFVFLILFLVGWIVTVFFI